MSVGWRKFRECTFCNRYICIGSIPVCDGIQNVERYLYRYFFRYQILPIPIPVLFSDTKFYRYRFQDFFLVPNFSNTHPGSGTYMAPVPIINLQISEILATKISSDTKKFRYRFRDFFRYQIFPIRPKK